MRTDVRAQSGGPRPAAVVVAEDAPDQALDLLREKVRPALAAEEANRARLFLAAAKLDPMSVAALLERVEDPRLRRQTALAVTLAVALGITFLALNFVLDIAYWFIDPRLREESK